MHTWSKTKDGWRLDTEGGFLVLKETESYLLLDYLMVHPEQRRRGIATHLMAECIHRFGERQIRLEIGTIEDPDPVVGTEPSELALESEELEKFYRKYGFCPASEDDDCMCRPGSRESTPESH